MSARAKWRQLKLTDVAEIAGRIGWKGLTAKEYTAEGPLFLSVHSLNYGDFVDYRDAFHISRARYDESPEIMLRENDVLICKDGAGIGKVGIVQTLVGPTTINSSLLLVRPSSEVLPKFLYYSLLSPQFQNIVQSRLQGATTPHLYQRDIAGFPVGLPPVDEQRRVIAILDMAFEAISAAIASAEKNLVNAREICDRCLNSVFAGRAEWREKNLGELAQFKNGLNFTKNSKGETVSIVGVKDFQQSFWVPINQLETVQIDGALNDAYLLQKDDLLIVRSNGNKQLIGRCLLTPDVPHRTSHSGFTIRIRITSPEVEPTYLAHYFKSGAIRKALIESGGGANISSLNQQALSALPVCFPSRANQIKIVEQLEIIKGEVAQLEAIYQKKVAALTKLKQSILGMAFAGELDRRRTQLEVAAE